MEPGLVGDRPGHMKELAGRSHAVALLPTAPAGTSVAFATSTAGESAAKLIELIMVSPAAKLPSGTWPCVVVSRFALGMAIGPGVWPVRPRSRGGGS